VNLGPRLPRGLLSWGRPVKRSPALRGRNRTRNNRADGAPKRAKPRDDPGRPGAALLTSLRTPELCLENPGVRGQSPPSGRGGSRRADSSGHPNVILKHLSLVISKIKYQLLGPTGRPVGGGAAQPCDPVARPERRAPGSIPGGPYSPATNPSSSRSASIRRSPAGSSWGAVTRGRPAASYTPG